MMRDKKPGRYEERVAEPLPERGPPPEPQDAPPPSETHPPDATRPAGPQPPDPFGREGTAKKYPPGAPDVTGDRQPRPHPSEIHPRPGQDRPPESALFPDVAAERSREMQGIPDLPRPPHPGYIPSPPPPETWVPPQDRPVPGEGFTHQGPAHTAQTLREIAAHLEEKKAAAGSAPWHITDELAVLRQIADELDIAWKMEEVDGEEDGPIARRSDPELHEPGKVKRGGGRPHEERA